MTKDKKIGSLYRALCGVAVFRGVTESELVKSFMAFAEADREGDKLRAYGAFVNCIYRSGGDLTNLLSKLIFEDENVYVTAVAAGEDCHAAIKACVTRELQIFAVFASLTPRDFANDLNFEIPLADFSSRSVDLETVYAKRTAEIAKHGYGIFASNGMFRFSDSAEHRIEPIVSADHISLDAFTGYEQERARVIANTQAFVEGKPSANVLLYGDAGTGKSSTVKAVANAFYSSGVRLIELRKDQMSLLPLVMEKINRNPLKFIIFIDDLSFNRNDDTFSMLKAALEGSASAKAPNAVIYATSNRRHIVRETFGDREGEDVHRNDTMQELLSLSARFGLAIRFEKPDRALYLKIVHELAEKHGINRDPKQLETEAEAFALSRGHRSPRCAEQFIDSLL